MWHKHKYEVTDVQLVTRVDGGEFTLLLKQCRHRKCEKTDWEHIPGHWPKEHFMKSD